jgi:class 3 adenylate cyclase
MMIELSTPIRSFFTPPEGLPREQGRFFVLWTITCGLSFLVHSLVIPLFLWMDLTVLAFQSIISLFIWAFVFWVGRRRNIYAAITLGGAEVCVYVAFTAWFIGWESGVQYLLFSAVVLVFIVPLHRWYTAVWMVIVPLEFLLLYLFVDRIAWTGNPDVIVVFGILNIAAAFGTIIILVGYQANLVRSAERAMDVAYAQSEALLNNVMPSVIANRLKKSDEVIADSFPQASILFADIENFTPLSQTMTPDEVVLLLNDLFSRIDTLVHKHGLEKIKTIGDAYMVAAGVPVRRDDHAQAISAFALDLQEELAAYNAEMGRNIRFRIGINSGPVVAGVIGKLRFLYDLWGDSVNTASRMETYGVPGEIQVAEDTRKLLADLYTFEDRGFIDIKGKGPMRTYILRERK